MQFHLQMTVNGGDAAWMEAHAGWHRLVDGVPSNWEMLFAYLWRLVAYGKHCIVMVMACCWSKHWYAPLLMMECIHTEGISLSKCVWVRRIIFSGSSYFQHSQMLLNTDSANESMNELHVSYMRTTARSCFGNVLNNSFPSKLLPHSLQSCAIIINS